MDHLFKKIERQTGVEFEEILALANAIQHADFQNERQVRKIVRKVSRLAKKPINDELENKIVASILQNGTSLDLQSIEKMMK